MRHYFLPGAITAHSGGMRPSPGKARRVASGGAPLRLLARPPRAVAAAIDLTSVAAAADDHLAAAGET
jgi:hypothetical protein